MVRGDAWKPVIENLPNHINIKDVKDLLQKADQLSYLNGVGYIAGNRVETQLDKTIVTPFLPDFLSLENVALQWLYRFLILEGLVEHNRTKPMADWSPMFLHMVDQGLHFLVFMATVLVLIEEGKAAPGDLSMEGEASLLESLVRSRVAQACAFLHPKAQDYGESFRRHGLPGILPRLWDKIARYAQLKADNRAGNFEKREDSARDLLGYSIIAYSLMLELPEELRKSYQPTSVYVTESNVMEGAEWKKVN
jgi:Nucleotide modification associated domain 1